MRLFPTGRLGGAVGVRGRQQVLPVRSDQLGRGLREGVPTRRLHQSDEVRPLDRREDGTVVHHRRVRAPAELTDKVSVYLQPDVSTVCGQRAAPPTPPSCFSPFPLGNNGKDNQ